MPNNKKIVTTTAQKKTYMRIINGKQQNSFSTTNSLTNFATNTSHNLKLPQRLILED
jgi:hypothetical protein